MTRLSIAHPVFAAIAVHGLCVLDAFFYLQLGGEQLCDSRPPVAVIDVHDPGASREAVKRKVTRVTTIELVDNLKAFGRQNLLHRGGPVLACKT
jgi:multidrug efflux pump subunit AcrB